MHRAFLPALCLLILASVATASVGPAPDVSCQGIFKTANPGPYRLETLPAATGLDLVGATLLVTDPEGIVHRLDAIPGAAFFVGANGRIAALERPEIDAIDSRLVVYDIGGRRLFSMAIDAPVNPALASDAAGLVLRDRTGIVRIDLETFEEVRYPALDLFAAGSEGRLAGVPFGETNEILIYDANGLASRIPLDVRPRRLAYDTEGTRLYVLDAQRLFRVSAGSAQPLYSAPAGSELQDILVSGDAIYVGERRIEQGSFVGSSVELGIDGGIARRVPGPVAPVTQGASAPVGAVQIPWPLLPNSQHAVGNTWGEYQNYGGAPYPHPGIDIFGSAGQAVYAVRSGVVKAVLTTGGDLYWRVAIGDSLTAGTCKGYLYAHLQQSSIAVHTGDLVIPGQFIGSLVQWPIYDFTHCHFARIEDSGAQWNGSWLAVDNPHPNFLNQNDTLPPVFEPARGADLLAFCNNETSTYQPPTSLHGAVDIICHVGDRIESSWVCSVQQLRYTIYPVNRPQYPIVDDKLSVVFDMTIDYYAGGSDYLWLNTLLYKKDSTCNTQGDYDFREFYHILSNSDGDGLCEQTDAQQAWNTAALPDGSYVVKVRAFDAAGNVTADSMTVTTVNGNPSSAAEAASPPELRPAVFPNPTSGEVSIAFTLAQAGHANMRIYDTQGRRLRTLVDRNLTPGRHAFGWDGRDARGRRLGSGAYSCVLTAPGGSSSAKIILSQ
jgi:murein DD-endopeptidase MepM/ murein hydrolase activator NlpD